MASSSPAPGRTLFIRQVPVEFPFEPYPCQVRYMEHVIEALQTGQNALLESPTGTGKTLGLLCAALAWRSLLVAQVQGQASTQRISKSLADDSPKNDYGERLLQGVQGAAGAVVAPEASLRGLVPAASSENGPGPTPLQSVPRIIYLTRTHSQIKQAVRELSRTAYCASVRTVVLGSRQHLCVHPVVSRLENATMQNVRCTQLTKERRCSFYLNAEQKFKEVGDDFFFIAVDSTSTLALPGRRPRDLEDLAAYGHQHAMCPYFLSREASAEAEIIFMPYNYLFDGKCRRSLGLSVEGDIIIGDEAHNLESICCDSLSFDFTAAERQRCVSAIQQLASALSSGLLNRDGREGSNTEPALHASDLHALLEIMVALEERISLVSQADAKASHARPGAENGGTVCFGQRRRIEGIDGVVLPGHAIESFLQCSSKDATLTEEAYERLLRGVEAAIRALTQLRQQFPDGTAAALDHSQAPEADAIETRDQGDPYTGLLHRQVRTTQRTSAAAWAAQVHALEQLSQVLELSRLFGKPETASTFAICVHEPAKGTAGTTHQAMNPSRLKTPSAYDGVGWPRQTPSQQRPPLSGTAAAEAASGKYVHQPAREHRSSTGYTLSFWCLWPGLALRRATSNAHAVLLTSGTLSPLESVASEMGASFPVRLQNSHVVDPATQVFAGILTKGPRDIQLNSSYANRHNREYISDLGSALVNIARVSPRGMLVFFPSYALLARFVEIWQTGAFHHNNPLNPAHRGRQPTQATVWDRLNAVKRIFMEPRDADASRQTVDAYRQWISSGRDACLFAVCRGRTGEGIDFADDFGRTVILVGLPFPSTTDPRIILKRDYLERQALHLRDHGKTITGRLWYVQQCLRAANQAMGRVIRHAQDFGAILLCDERFRAHLRDLPRWLSAASSDADPRATHNIQVFERFGTFMSNLCGFWHSERIRQLSAAQLELATSVPPVRTPVDPFQASKDEQPRLQSMAQHAAMIGRQSQEYDQAGKTGTCDARRARSLSLSSQSSKRLRETNVAATAVSSTSTAEPGLVWKAKAERRAVSAVHKDAALARGSQMISKTIMERIRARVGDRTFSLIFQQMKRYYRLALIARQPQHSVELQQIQTELQRLVNDPSDFEQLRLLLGEGAPAMRSST
jgi:Rad3-related DNA helicase